MRFIAIGTGLIALLSLGGSAPLALAQSAGQAAKEAVEMPKPGPEMAAVLKLFGHGATWEGTVPAGALGPDAPATTSSGRATCGPLVGGLWCRCDVQNTMGSGNQAKTWMGHMIVGYDLGSKAYRAVVVDNTGIMTVYDARMDGATLTLETPEPILFMGAMLKDRLTFVGGADGIMTSYKDEHQIGDGAWMPFETVDHVVTLGAPPEGKKPAATSVKAK